MISVGFSRIHLLLLREGENKSNENIYGKKDVPHCKTYTEQMPRFCSAENNQQGYTTPSRIEPSFNAS
jgi:hypothetical protein